MGKFDMIVGSFAVLSVLSMGYGMAAPSQELAKSLFSGLENALAASAAQSSSADLENQLRIKLESAGCSPDAVSSLKVITENPCYKVVQSSVYVQQFFLNTLNYTSYLPEYFESFYNTDCYNSGLPYRSAFQCYLNKIPAKKTADLFKDMKVLVDYFNTAVDTYNANYKECAEGSSSTRYSVGNEVFNSIESLVSRYCPEGTKLSDDSESK